MSINLIIPARYGSTRFPGKPLALISGKPMIQHVYERARQAKGLDHIYVATDDERIRQAVESFGGEVVMTRADAASGTDRIDDAATRLGLDDDDLIINLQGDQPLIDPRSIEKLVQLFLDAPGEFEMATLAFLITDPADQNDPMQVKMVFDQAFFALYFSRARIPFNRDNESDCPVYKHLGIYGYTRRFVREFGRLPVSRLEHLEKLEQLRALESGYRIKVAVVDANPPEVDTPEDIAKCEAFLAK